MSSVRPQFPLVSRRQIHGRRLLTLFCIPFLAVHLFADSSETFDKTIRPILADRCFACHSAKKQKGDLDLERFTLLAEVKKDPAVWQSVQEQLANN